MSDLLGEEREIIQTAIAIYIRRCLTEDAMPPEMNDKAYVREAMIEAGAVEQVEDKRKRDLVKALNLFLKEPLT